MCLNVHTDSNMIVCFHSISNNLIFVVRHRKYIQRFVINLSYKLNY